LLVQAIAAPPEQIGKGLTDGGLTGPLSLGNVAQNRALASVFRAAAMRELSRAQAEALAPIRESILTAMAIEDDGARRAALVKIQKDLPTNLKTVSARSGEVVTALSDIIGTALMSGATTAAARQAV
jgi:hypothetical protein